MPSPRVPALLCTALLATGAGAAPLPLDVIGLYLTGATPVAGGQGYQVGDTLALPGGASATVSQTTTGNAIAAVTVRQPLMHACAPNQPVPVHAGGGSGATLSLALLAPTGYGTRRLSQCYSGPAVTVRRSANEPGVAIGFLPDGSLDAASLDRYTAPPATLQGYARFDSGVAPRVEAWHDQGGGGNDATQPVPGKRPVLAGTRLHGNSRALLFDAHAGAGEWDPADTFLRLPMGVALDANRFTLVALAEATSAFAPVGFITVGAMAGKNAGLGFARHNTQPTACEGGGDNVYAATVPTETPAVIICSADEQGKAIDMLGTHRSASGGNGAHLRGGALGQSGFNRSGLVNMSAAIIVPWPLDAATRAALGESLAQSFGLAPPSGGVIVVLGDSHSDGSGAPFQQGWPAQMLSQLGRADLQLVNAASYGGRLAAAVERWEQYALPNLAASSSPNKLVILQGGYNDQQYGDSAAAILATYRRGAALAHAAGAKVVCVADVIRSAPSATNRVVLEVNAALRAPLKGCDAVLDWASEAAFSGQSGLYPPPYFASDQVHLSAEGQARQARMAAKVVGKVLGF